MKTGVIFVLLRDNKILMQQRDANCQRFPFRWCLPGGGSEEGEDYGTTLVREVKEEYDIDLKLSECRHFMDFDYNEGHSQVYICNVNQNQTPILQEGLAMEWMTLEEIARIKLGFEQEPIVNELYKELQNKT